jgi:copper transport protein
MQRPLKLSLLAVIITSLIFTGVALAHADLLRSDPAENSTLDTAPSQINLQFSEPIEPAFSSIDVLFEDGSTVDAGDSAVSNSDPNQISVSLTDQRQGTYIVSWRVLSSADGHITSGAFVFSVGKPINTAITGESRAASTSPLDMLARALTFIGQTALVGVLIFRWLIWLPALKSAGLDNAVDDRAIKFTHRMVLVILGLNALGAILTIAAQSQLAGAAGGAWLATRVGRVWIGRAATLIALGVMSEDIAAVGRRDRGSIWVNVIVGWLSLQLLFLTTLTSHSAAVIDPPLLPFAADWLHLIGTSLWIGALIQMALIVPRVAKELNDEDRAWLWLKVVVKFSVSGAFGVALLLLTGTYMSFLHVGDWAALINTVYGQALLIKLALVGVAMLLGGFNLIISKARLDRSVDAPGNSVTRSVQRRTRRVIFLEALIGVCVVAMAGVLTDLPRSKDPQPTVAAGALQLTQSIDAIDAALTIAPARSGRSNFKVLLSQDGQAITNAQSVSFRFTYLTRGLGTTKADAISSADGSFTASGAYLSLAGTWQIEVAVRRVNAFDVFAAYRVRVGGDGLITSADRPTLLDDLTHWLSIYGLVFGGVVAILMAVIWLVITFNATSQRWLQAVLLIPTLIAVPIGVRSIATFVSEATPGLTLTNPFLPDAASLALGEKLFARNCAVCHGEAGRGNGPTAAYFNGRVPDYGSGHLDIHTDGDIFYWIQNGFGGDSPMPVFKEILADDEIWNLVNYVRRLRNEATGPAPTPSSGASSAVLQPYAPDSFIAPNIVFTTTTTATPFAKRNDPDALNLLIRADRSMNALASLSEDQSIKDEADHELIVRFDYAAPDRLRYTIKNGATAIDIGTFDYQQKPDGTWLKNERAIPFKWPSFQYATLATNAQIQPNENLNGVNAAVVSFEYGNFSWRVWIDPSTSHLLKLTMDGSSHHMISIFSNFNSAPAIDAPIP